MFGGVNSVRLFFDVEGAGLVPDGAGWKNARATEGIVAKQKDPAYRRDARSGLIKVKTSD
jgi:hypothetical protein